MRLDEIFGVQSAKRTNKWAKRGDRFEKVDTSRESLTTIRKNKLVPKEESK